MNTTHLQHITLVVASLLVVSCEGPVAQKTMPTASIPFEGELLEKPLAPALSQTLSYTQSVVVPVVETKVSEELLQTTNAANRLSQVDQGRQDPFAPFTQVSTIKNAAAVQSESAPSTTPLPGLVSPPGVALLPVPQLPNGVLPPLPPASETATNTLPQVAVNPSNGVAPAVPAAEQTPELPPVAASSPVVTGPLVNTIEIRGVIHFNTGMAAVVMVPNERSSRYVRMGDRLANGKVLVKRIEIEGQGQPIVVLEENGKEYTKIVSSSAIAQSF